MTISNNYGPVLIFALKRYRFDVRLKLEDPEIRNDPQLFSYYSEELMVIDGIMDQIHLFVEE